MTDVLVAALSMLIGFGVLSLLWVLFSRSVQLIGVDRFVLSVSYVLMIALSGAVSFALVLTAIEIGEFVLGLFGG